VRTGWTGDTLGHLLFWSGVAALGAGSGFLVMGNSTAASLGSAATYEAYAADRSKAPFQQKLGAGLLTGGGLLLAGGVTRFFLKASEASQP
jgi:hypothetical protein